MVTITYSHHSLIQGNRNGALYGAIFTIILAIVFTAFQGIEYSVSSFTISDGAFGSCFYFGTGLIIAPIKNFNNEDFITNKLSPFWVTGFSDAESSFSIRVGKDLSRKHNIRVSPVFSIELHNRDIFLLNIIKNFFGLGTIITRIRRGKPTAIYSVQSLKDLNEVIIPHFKLYPLLTQKRADFILFSSVVELMIKEKKLNYESLVKILSIKASMNKGLSDSLMILFPGIKKVERAIISSQSIKSPSWLSGFVDGEGCFYIKTKKKNNTVIQITPTFSISQHSRDFYLMNIIKDYLGCGILEKVKTRPNSVNFVVYKNSDISKIIIPLFKENIVLGVKSLDFFDFCKVNNLIEKKLHLTPEGISEIIRIKKGMNSKRK